MSLKLHKIPILQQKKTSPFLSYVLQNFSGKILLIPPFLKIGIHMPALTPI